MSLRGALNFVRRSDRDATIEASAEDLTAAALAQDVARARERVVRLRHLLGVAEAALEQRRWELEVYALHGTAPRRAGLAKRVNEMASSALKRALRTGQRPAATPLPTVPPAPTPVVDLEDE